MGPTTDKYLSFLLRLAGRSPAETQRIPRAAALLSKNITYRHAHTTEDLASELGASVLAQGTGWEDDSTRHSFHITSGYKVLPGCVGTEAGAALLVSIPSQAAPAHPGTQIWLPTARSQGQERLRGSADLISPLPSALGDAKAQSQSLLLSPERNRALS